jgi:chitin disaccharide deacetylase
MVKLSEQLAVPLRECTPRVRYCGDFYGQTGEGDPLPDVLSVEGLKRVVAPLREGMTELGCHPGYGANLATVYRCERDIEREVLCAPTVPEMLATMGFELCSFEDLPRLRKVPTRAPARRGRGSLLRAR